TKKLVVMGACGVSLYRIALALVVFALGGSAVLFAIDERVLGEANKTAAQMRDSLRDHKAPPPTITLATNQWMVGEVGRIYAYGAFGDDARPGGPPTITGLSVFEPVPSPYRLRSHLHAARAWFEGTAWHAEHGWEERFETDSASRTDFERQAIALPPVADFRRAQVDPSTMSFMEY